MEDLSALPPLGTEEELTAILDDMVADLAPRMFAVVQVYGDRVDGRIVGWGIAFDDHAEIVGVDGRLTMRLEEPHNALRCFTWSTDITPRLVWVNPAPAHAAVAS